MDSLNSQIPENATALPYTPKRMLIILLLVATLSGIIGYLIGVKLDKSAKRPVTSQIISTLPSPTPTAIPTATLYPLLTSTINPLSQIPTPMYTPGGPTVSDWQPTPLQSTQDLPLIASAVIDWVLQHHSSPNPQISFTENDGKYARGLLGDLTQAGGEGWYAAKINGNWTVVYVGQASPLCSDIVQYHLPKDWLPCDSSF